MSLATGFFLAEFPSLSLPAHWVLGVVTSVLFFGSVSVHVLGHAYLALHEGIPVKQHHAVHLWRRGADNRGPHSPGAEFRIAIAGPLTSLVLDAGFGALWLVDNRSRCWRHRVCG